MFTPRIVYILLALDVGAIWSCLVLLVALWRQQRYARSLSVPPAPRPVAEGPTAPLPTFPAVDPWAGAETWPAVPVANLLPVATRPPARPAWDVPTAAHAAVEATRWETRRHIARPRNDPPAAVRPRYVELVLTRP